ncbi:MAG: FIST C-terminal domain-containing protein [Oscillospiraceae bacterium]|jgi:hypothetical protein|nr:FIST C-terminal domain-containing protein [Oscillospiraceae bacterium]
MTDIRTAFTVNLDDSEAAVKEILEQLKPESFLENSAAILAGHKEFFESGVASDITAALGIPSIGNCTTGNYVSGAMTEEYYMLSIIVFTSDTLFFKSARTSYDFRADIQGSVDGMVERLLKKSGGIEPSVVMTTQTLDNEIGNDIITQYISDNFTEALMFGAVAINVDELEVNGSTILYDTETIEIGAAVLGIFGDFDKEFTYIPLQEKNAFNWEAIVTEAKDNVVKTINYVPPLTFFQDLKILNANEVTYAFTLPLMVDGRDGIEAVARSIIGFAPDGSAVTTARIPVGAMLALGSISDEYVVETAKKAADYINKEHPKAVFIVSCATRNFALGANAFAEILKISELVDPDIKVFFTYAGGEICPVRNAVKNNYVTRMHNNTLTMCLFK